MDVSKKKYKTKGHNGSLHAKIIVRDCFWSYRNM
jgi:hypothetical protein